MEEWEVTSLRLQCELAQRVPARLTAKDGTRYEKSHHYSARRLACPPQRRIRSSQDRQRYCPVGGSRYRYAQPLPPVVTVAAAEAYRERIINALTPENRHFDPLMTLYLTDDTSAAEVARLAESSVVHAIKLYPAGATTNSAAGVNDLSSLFPVFEAMEKHDVPLLIHGEVTDSDIDILIERRCLLICT